MNYIKALLNQVEIDINVPILDAKAGNLHNSIALRKEGFMVSSMGVDKALQGNHLDFMDSPFTDGNILLESNDDTELAHALEMIPEGRRVFVLTSNDMLAHVLGIKTIVQYYNSPLCWMVIQKGYHGNTHITWVE